MQLSYFRFSYFNWPGAVHFFQNRIRFSIWFLFSSDFSTYWVFSFWNLKKGVPFVAEKGFKHKLAAILSADAIEYSQLMGEDEEATAAPSFI